MRITSTDGRSWLDIDRKVYDSGHYEWVAEASVTTGNGDTFQGINRSLYFERFEEFASAFDRFILNRNVGVRLTGTYDTVISVSGTAHHVTLEFRIGAADHIAHSYAVIGAFELDQERLSEISGQLNELCSIDA